GPAPGMPVAGPGSIPGIPPGPRKSGLSKGALIAIIGGGGAFVLLVAVLVLAFVLNSVAKSGQAVADDAEQATGTPEDAVTAYLQAVADGDAEAALGYLESTPSTTELLTDEVLMASAQQAPLTDITV